jgi:hypothetical protein
MSDAIDFVRFLEANDNAFKYMGEIREKAISKDREGLVNVTNEAFRQVGVMAVEYLKAKPEEEKLVKQSFSVAYDNATRTILLVGKMLNIANGEIPQYKTLFDEENINGLYHKIEFLPKEFDAGTEDYNLKHVQTLHGMIRYLHQRGLEATFDARALASSDCDTYSEHVTKFRMHRGDFKIIDLDNQITQEGKKRISNGYSLEEKDIINRPMQAILEFYKQGIQTQSIDYYNMFLKRDSMNLHVKLYQHSAEIDTVLKGDKSYIKFRYNEYLNDAWRDRITYIKTGIELLGFDVAEAKRNIVTDWDHKNEMIRADKTSDEESIKGTLTELVRLLTSTTHMNCAFESINGFIDPEMALKMFFSGDTDMRSKFEEIQCRSDVDSFPSPPWHENAFCKEYDGNTYEEKVENAMKEYAPKVKQFWDSVHKKELHIDSYYMELKDVSLKDLAAKRLKQFHIKTNTEKKDTE